jgi:hypothetical protein
VPAQWLNSGAVPVIFISNIYAFSGTAPVCDSFLRLQIFARLMRNAAVLFNVSFTAARNSVADFNVKLKMNVSKKQMSRGINGCCCWKLKMSDSESYELV